jgi:adenylate cyclase
MVYQPLMAAMTSEASEEEYQKAYSMLVEKDTNAVLGFEALSTRYPEDPLIALHLGRLRAGEQGDVIVMSEK